jgi:hypothetical protein
MSEFIRQKLDLSDYVNEIAEKVNRRCNQAALDKAAMTLAEYGYVKVVRCRDCENYEYREHLGRSYCCGEYATEPDGYCAWGVKRKKEGA